MSDGIEDVPPSGGIPTKEVTQAMRDYLEQSKRPSGIRPVLAELKARGFDVSFATVQRHLSDQKSIIAARDRLQNTRTHAKKLSLPKQEEVSRKAIIESIIGTPGNLKSNAEIALYENKIRMTLNIMLMQMLMERPERILIDPRGFAAFVDAMTISSKVSGGAAFEVLPPGINPEVNGSDMKDITPVTRNQNVASIEAFRSFNQNGNGKGN